MSGEILSWSLTGVKEIKNPYSEEFKGGLICLAILLDYFDPSKYDFGEINLCFEIKLDEQFFTYFNAVPVFIVI